MTDVTYDAAVIVRDQTRLATAPTEIEPGLFIVVDTDGDHQLIDARDHIQRTKDHPRRKTGSVTLAQHDSFTDYLAKHALPDTELWADIDKDRVVAVINAHEGSADRTIRDEGRAGWGDHRATLQLVTTQDWRDWTANSGKLVGQQEFAEFVEQHLPNFLRPSAADMLELAQTIKGHTKVSFESSKRVKSGETAIEWREDTTAAAGKKGTLEIPDTIDLGMQVYEGGAPYKLTARFRYRIGGGALLLGYVLERAGDVVRDAFGQVVQQVAADTERDVWHGTP
jgi:uncharacterized protein YfdQ (DUF2303 family)